jgi:hypothetical protein
MNKNVYNRLPASLPSRYDQWQGFCVCIMQFENLSEKYLYEIPVKGDLFCICMSGVSPLMAEVPAPTGIHQIFGKRSVNKPLQTLLWPDPVPQIGEKCCPDRTPLKGNYFFI